MSINVDKRRSGLELVSVGLGKIGAIQLLLDGK
jgi:hypothetical protein